jgi:hypothetical protein
MEQKNNLSLSSSLPFSLATKLLTTLPPKIDSDHTAMRLIAETWEFRRKNLCLLRFHV